MAGRSPQRDQLCGGRTRKECSPGWRDWHQVSSSIFSQPPALSAEGSEVQLRGAPGVLALTNPSTAPPRVRVCSPAPGLPAWRLPCPTAEEFVLRERPGVVASCTARPLSERGAGRLGTAHEIGAPGIAHCATTRGMRVDIEAASIGTAYSWIQKGLGRLATGADHGVATNNLAAAGPSGDQPSVLRRPDAHERLPRWAATYHHTTSSSLYYAPREGRRSLPRMAWRTVSGRFRPTFWRS